MNSSMQRSGGAVGATADSLMLAQRCLPPAVCVLDVICDPLHRYAHTRLIKTPGSSCRSASHVIWGGKCEERSYMPDCNWFVFVVSQAIERDRVRY